VEVVELNVKTYSRTKSLFFAVMWFVGSFFVNTVGGEFFYERTVSTYVALLAFASLQFILGGAFSLILGSINHKAYFEIFSWMVVLVLIERIFFRSYVFLEVDLVTIASVSGDMLAGFVGFLFGVFINKLIRKGPLL
jgi:hypothetical protein